jgi:hypothetical protein
LLERICGSAFGRWSKNMSTWPAMTSAEAGAPPL